MRIALISDIHANLSALTAVLEDIQKKKPDMVFSLGDQIGMGPEPTQVLDLLAREKIPCLLGNHEVRVLSYREGVDPALCEDINYAFVRWSAEKLLGYDIGFPMSRSLDTPLGALYMTHAGIDDPFARIMPCATGEQKAVLEGLSQVAAAVVAVGHSHYTYQLFTQNRPIVIVGSTGLSHNHIPGTGEYTLLEIDETGVLIYPQIVKYDNMQLFQTFLKSGLSVCEPVSARVVWEEMFYNRSRLVPFVDFAFSRARAQGEGRITEQVWLETAAAFDWMDGNSDCQRFWGL